MRHFAGAMLVGLWALGLSAVAGQAQSDGSVRSPVVVELFTSQGCSACPPANDLIAELAARPDVLPLSLHVDYWDYIGWVDRFAKPDFAKRQKAYAKAAGRRMVYTPQMVIGGRLEVAGHDPIKLVSAIQEEQARSGLVRIDVLADGQGGARVRLTQAAGQAGGEGVAERSAHVILVRFRPSATTEITRGENAGHTGVSTNIVTDWLVLGIWDGTPGAEFPLPSPDATLEPLSRAVLVQETGYGPILSAARLD